MGVNSGTLAVICDLVESRPSLLARLLEFDLLGYLFPPRSLSQLGNVNSDSVSYYERQTRSTGHDLPGKYSYAATTSITSYGWTKEGKPILHKEGEAKPVYQRGTRDSRTAQVMLLTLLALLFAAPLKAQVQYPQTVTVGRVSVVVPGDAALAKNNVNSPLKRSQTTYYVSKSLEATVTVTYVEFKDTSAVKPRLTAFLEQFIASYGSVSHLASIKEDGRKGMSISAEVFHNRSQSNFTYVETRVFADETRLYAVTIQSEVTPSQSLRTTEYTEILSSMRVSQ